MAKTGLFLGICLMVSFASTASEPQVVGMQSVQGIVVTLLTDSGEISVGTNHFVLEVHSAVRKRLLDVGLPTLTASCAIPNGRPLRAAARITPGDTLGRYLGTITMPRPGA